MIFERTPLDGVYVIRPEPARDERGYFVRSFCREEFSARGLNPCIAQTSRSFNFERGTLRGLHLQAAPHAEAKLVRCTRGAIYDVAVDLREDSTTRLQHIAIELSAREGVQLYIPEGFAHGFQTLEDESEVFYQISVPHVPEASRGFHHASPVLKIQWPLPVSKISDRDAALEKLLP